MHVHACSCNCSDGGAPPEVQEARGSVGKLGQHLLLLQEADSTLTPAPEPGLKPLRTGGLLWQ
eukprot:3500029-Prorocentrum_lima.AAC.1